MISIYTDGSVDDNYKRKNLGGYAYIVVNEFGIKTREFVEGDKDTTNNRMELKAVIQALKDHYNTDEQIMIYSDSTYVVNAINADWVSGWKKRNWQKKGQDIPNKELWLELLSYLKPNIKLVWIKSHQGNVWNEAVDALAKTKTIKQKKYKVINE